MKPSPQLVKLTRELGRVIGEKRDAKEALTALTLILGGVINQSPGDKAERENLARQIFAVLLDMIAFEDRKKQ